MVIKFVEPLSEYARMLKSISAAIHQQESKKKMFSKMLAEFVSVTVVVKLFLPLIIVFTSFTNVGDEAN